MLKIVLKEVLLRKSANLGAQKSAKEKVPLQISAYFKGPKSARKGGTTKKSAEKL